MSHLARVAKTALESQGLFTFLGDDGYVIQVQNLGGDVLSLLVTDPDGNPVFDHYANHDLLLRHLKLHGGHLH